MKTKVLVGPPQHFTKPVEDVVQKYIDFYKEEISRAESTLKIFRPALALMEKSLQGLKAEEGEGGTKSD